MIYPKKLALGDEIRIIAPSCSMGIISQKNRAIANGRFNELGLHVSFGRYSEEMDSFRSSSIHSRIKDIHEAFSNKNVKAIFAAIGGLNANQLLGQIDWNLIKNNPKIFCGYSDITALNVALLAKSGLVSYSGPVYASFSEKQMFQYTLDYFKKCLFKDSPYFLSPPESWSDDKWYEDQQKRCFFQNTGYVILREGSAEGTLFGSNLCTFNLLQGTKYFPKIQNGILFLEEDGTVNPGEFDRNLQSLLQTIPPQNIRGLLIGRFQKKTGMTIEMLRKIIESKKELDDIPIVADIDFGHTRPMVTLPVGGRLKMSLTGSKCLLKVIKH